MPAEGAAFESIIAPSPTEGFFMPGARAVIFVNGEQADLEGMLGFLHPEDYLVAADGGLRHFFSLNLSPDLLIGDLDSVSVDDVVRVEQSGGRVIQFPIHKNETDLELALQAVIEQGCQSIWIMGALGGRLDMILANISLLMLPELAGLDVRLGDGIDEVFLIEPDDVGKEIIGQTGDRVSLLPWGGPAGGVQTENLYYPLRQETLFPERTRGISNLMTSQSARVTIESGRLICIHTRGRSHQSDEEE